MYGRFLDNSPAKENKNNLFDGACRVLMLDLICIQAGFFLAFFDFSKHLSNFPVFRKLTNANLRHVKEMKKRHVQKNLSLWVSISVNLSHEEVLVERRECTSLIGRYTPAIYSLSFNSKSGINRILINFCSTQAILVASRFNGYLRIVVKHRSLHVSTPFSQGLLKFEISEFVLRINFSTQKKMLIQDTNRKAIIFEKKKKQ